MFSPGSPITIPPMVSVYVKGIGWLREDVAASGATSGAAVAAIAYYPIVLPSSCVVRRVWWANGATVSGGATIQCGIYSDAGYAPSVRLIYGSATQGTANEVQFVDVTDTALPPGLYWIAIVSSTTTNTTLFSCAISSGSYDAVVRFSQATTSLPETATPAESGATAIWLCGFSTTSAP